MAHIKIIEIIESPSATSPNKGLKMFDVVKEMIQKGEPVVVSFSGIEDVVTSFTNAFFGRLYMEFPSKLLTEKFKITEVTNDIWQSKIDLSIRLATDNNTRVAHNKGIDELMES